MPTAFRRLLLGSITLLCLLADPAAAQRSVPDRIASDHGDGHVFAFVVPAAMAKGSAASDCVPSEQCCKVCTKGQACGNTCISASYTCRKGRGCACNASEICR